MTKVEMIYKLGFYISRMKIDMQELEGDETNKSYVEYLKAFAAFLESISNYLIKNTPDTQT